MPRRREGIRFIHPLHLAPLLAVLLLTAASAAPIHDHFRATGSVQLDGTGHVDWRTTGATLTATDQDLEVVLTVDAAALRLFNVQDSYLVQRDPAGGERAFDGPGLESPLWSGQTAGSLRVTLHADEAGALRFLPVEDFLAFSTNVTGLSVSPLGTVVHDPHQSALRHVPEVGGQSVHPTDPYTVATADGRPDPVGRAVVVVVGADVLLPDGSSLDVPGRHANGTLSNRDPVTRSDLFVHDNHLLLVEADGFLVEAPPARWQVAAAGLAGSFQGVGQWRGLDGDVRFGDDQASDPDVLILDGTFDLRGRLGPDEGRWTLRGSVDQVSVDLEPFRLLDAQVVGGGALLGGLLLLPLLRDVLAAVVARSREPLANPTRQGILASVHQHQPVPMRRLQEETGLARGTLRYHLRVLESSHVLQRVVHAGRGRNATYVLNSGSLLFRAGALSGQGDDDGAVVGEALSAATTHPVRHSLYEHLLRHGDSDLETLREVAAAATRRGTIAPSTLSYHLQILGKAGVVRHAWHDGRKQYAAAIDAAQAQALQYRNYLRRPVWRDAVKHLLDHDAVPREQLTAVLVQLGHRPGRATDALTSLGRLGILRDDAGSLRLHPQVASALRTEVAT